MRIYEFLERTLDQLTLATLTLSGMALAARAIHGPFHLMSVPVNSPLNAESVFGLMLVILVLRHSRNSGPMTPEPLRYSPAWIVLILLLTIAALWRAIQFPLVFDDYTLVSYGHGMTGPMARYYLTHAGGDGFYRPIGYLSLALDSRWAGYSPLGWHLLNLALHLANIVLVWCLARRFLHDHGAALWAAAVFALHGTVLLMAAFLAARFDVLAVFFVLAGLVLFLRYLDAGDRLALTASFLCACLGGLTKEIAFVFPLLAMLVSGRNAWMARRAIAGYFGIAGIIFCYRFWLLAGIGGYRNPLTGEPEILHPRILPVLKGFGLRIWSVFDFSMNWSREPEIWLVSMLLACLGVLGWIALRTQAARPAVLRSLGFISISLLPVATLLLVDSSLLGAWRFYLALVGFAMFLAAAIQGIKGREQVVAGVVLIAFQVAVLQHNIAIWGQVASLVDHKCFEAAHGINPPLPSALPAQVDGVPFLRNGFEACVAFHQEILNRRPTLQAAQ